MGSPNPTQFTALSAIYEHAKKINGADHQTSVILAFNLAQLSWTEESWTDFRAHGFGPAILEMHM